jgi:hypothetical protein
LDDAVHFSEWQEVRSCIISFSVGTNVEHPAGGSGRDRFSRRKIFDDSRENKVGQKGKGQVHAEAGPAPLRQLPA